MKLSKLEVSILCTALEHLYIDKDKCLLNFKGIKKLAEIQSKFAEILLPVNAKDVKDSLEETMLKNINYTDKL